MLYLNLFLQRATLDLLGWKIVTYFLIHKNDFNIRKNIINEESIALKKLSSKS